MHQPSEAPSWPAAPRGGITLVQHPAWEAARNAVLDRAAEGPVTVFLTGEPGSGKTWLLRELAACLGQHGFPTMVLLRGDLPVPLGDGVAVLVDEASYMPDETCASLAVQQRGVVVLADIGPFAFAPVEGAPMPVFVHLRLLKPAEIGPFVMDWLQQEKMPSVVVEPDALARLGEHSGGAARLISQLLTAALAVSRVSGIDRLTANLIDQVAGFRLGTSMPDIVPEVIPQAPVATAVPEPVVAVPPLLPSSPMPARRVRLRYTKTATALAACVVATLLVPGLLHRAPPVVATVQPAPTLPPIQSAQTTAPDVMPAAPPVTTASRAVQEPATSASSMLADRLAPAPSGSAPPGVAADSLPPLQAANVPEPSAAVSVAQPLLAAVPAAPVLVAMPTQIAMPRPVSPVVEAPPRITVAAVPKPVAIPIIASGVLPATPAVARPSAAGLVLVARPGDTLQRLYADIYRDRRAPPLSAILAANPGRFKPGAIIVFPEPIGGWGRDQR